MKSMTTDRNVDQNVDRTENVVTDRRAVRDSRTFRLVVWNMWFLGIGLIGALMFWLANDFSHGIHANLTEEHGRVQASQQVLLQNVTEFQDGLLNFDYNVSVNIESGILRSNASHIISVLGGMRTSDNRIEDAKYEYRDALQELIAVSDRLSRGEITDIEVMVVSLENAMQGVADKADGLDVEINYFQNGAGMWRRLITSVF